MSKKVDWNAIRAEYIGGGISQRKLADKYGVNPDNLMQKANREHWKADRDKAVSNAIAKVQQKSASAISNNTEIAARIKTKLLKRLEAEIDKLPDSVGSGTVNSVIESVPGQKGARTRKEVSKEYRLKDLAAAYKALTDDMNLNNSSEPVRIVIDV